MPITPKDRVKDTTTTTGTGDVTLSGTAPSGFQTFNAAHGTGSTNQFCYCIQGGAEWEVGISYLSASTTLERGGVQTVLASSNSGSAVSFSAGTKNVFEVWPAVMATRPLTAYQGTDAVYTSDNTLNDTNLSCSVEAGTTYIIDAIIFADGGGAGLKHAFGGTATITNFRASYVGIIDGLFQEQTSSTSTGEIEFASGAGFEYITAVKGTVVINAAGTLILKASQAGPGSGSAGTLMAESFMTLTRVV